ncbi:MAG: hypothetical protein ACYTGN_11325 [Planctomycetota bacterium]|jgi:hypothetical protein
MNRQIATMGFCFVFIILFLQQGCLRRAVLRIRNTPMETKAAPALTSTQWILPEGQAAPSTLKGHWTLLAFFKPS